MGQMNFKAQGRIAQPYPPYGHRTVMQLRHSTTLAQPQEGATPWKGKVRPTRPPPLPWLLSSLSNTVLGHGNLLRTRQL